MYFCVFLAVSICIDTRVHKNVCVCVRMCEGEREKRDSVTDKNTSEYRYITHTHMLIAKQQGHIKIVLYVTEPHTLWGGYI